MRSENGLDVDLDALAQVLARADVLTIGFMLFPERLLVDVRSGTNVPQFADIVPPAGSVEERYLWLGQYRGSLGAPEAFSFFVWPQTVRGMIERGVLRPLYARLAGDAQGALDSALRQAERLEQVAVAAAVRGGEQWPALWQCSRA